MKNKFLLAATSAVLLFSANSFAADFIVTPKIGAVYFSEPQAVADAGKKIGVADLKLPENFTDKLNYFAGLEVAYKITDNINLGVSAQYFFSPSIKLSGTFSQPFTPPVVAPFDYKAQPVSVEWTPDIATGMVTGSVGYNVGIANIGLEAGVGVSRIKQTMVTSISMVDVPGVAPNATTYKIQKSTFVETDAEYTLAWQVGASVDFELAEGVALKVNGGYMHLGKTAADAKGKLTVDSTAATDSTIVANEYKGFFAGLGVKISL